MDMDLDWCPVCERAIINPEDARRSLPPSPSDDATPSRSTASTAAAANHHPNGKLVKSRQGTIKGKHPTTATVAGPSGAAAPPTNGARLRRNGNSGKNLAAKMGALKPFAPPADDGDHAAAAPSRDGTIRRPTGKRVQLVDAKKDTHEADRPVEGVTGQLYCSEECRRFDEAQDEDYYPGRGASRPSPWSRNQRLPSPGGGWAEDNGGYSSASDHYSEGSGSRRYSSGVDSIGRRSNDSISSLNAVVGDANGEPQMAPVTSRLGGLRGLRAMTPISTPATETAPSPKLVSRPMTVRSKSDHGTAAAGAHVNALAVSSGNADASRHSRSYDKDLPKRTPLLFAPNGSPLVQPTFPQRMHHHHAQQAHHQKTLSMSPGSPTLSTLSRFSDSGASTAPSYHSEFRGLGHRDEKPRSLYGDYAGPRRNPSSSSLASNGGGAGLGAHGYGRSPNDHLAVLSSSLGSFRSLHRPMEQVTPTQSLTSGPAMPGGYAWHDPAAPSTFTTITGAGRDQFPGPTPRPGSSSSLASGASRRDSSSSARKGMFRPDLLQAHSDSDTSSPPSSPGYPPMHSPFAGVGSLPHPVLAGVKATDAGFDVPRSAKKGSQAHWQHQIQQAQNRSWSWDHLPPYVPQYPAMDVEQVRRSRSGIQSAAGKGFAGLSTTDDEEDEVENHDDGRRSLKAVGRGATVPMPSSKKRLFIFNQEE